MCYTIQEIKKKIIPIAIKYQVNKVSLFGSYARGEANNKSDIDMLIDKGQMQGLLEYFGFVSALEDTLGIHVDVVTDTITDKAFLSKILKDEVVLYDKQG